MELAVGPLGVVQAADREIARQTARRARALAAFAATRPASADRRPGQPGAMSAERRAGRPEVLADVSEWAAQELVVALSITRTAAEDELARALTLVHRLPRTLEALEQGLLHTRHLWPLLEKVAPVTDRGVRARLERDLVAWVASRDVTTPAQLGAKVRRELLARNVVSAARELAAALRRRGVTVRPDRVDGMAVLQALLTVPEAEALLAALGRYADALDDGDGDGEPRTCGQRMADCLMDLVLRPGRTDLPVVQAQLTVIAPVTTMLGGDAAGEVEGHPVPAEMVRALATGFGLLPEEPPCVPAAGAEDAAGNDQADERWWAEVEARALRGEWGGAEAPPPEELDRWWAEDGLPAVEEWLPEVADGSDRADAQELASWSAADRTVEQAGATMLDLDRQLSRACTAVQLAELEEAAVADDRERSPAGRLSSARDTLTALTHASEERRAALADLLHRTGGGGLVDRPRIAVTDALTGALLALTDARDLRSRARRGAGLGPPGPSPTYPPGAELDRFLRARDRRCRFPGCRNRVPRGGELDHLVPWPDGPTAAENLTGFCTTHHRGKHQAPGWRYDLSSDGRLTVTSPSRLTAATAPPPF